MAAVMANSPELACASTFKSPLHAIRGDGCDGFSTADMYADSQVRVAQWRKNLVSTASFEAQTGLRDLVHERESLKDLQEDLSGLKGLVEAASQLQAGGARLAEVVQSSNAATLDRAQATVRFRDAFQEAAETNRQKAVEEEANMQEKRQAAEARHLEALKLLATYRERLGLDISRVAPQTVRMTFSLLDSDDASREFSFILGLAGVDGYFCVKECAPQVPELTKLLNELNATTTSATSLPRFVCGMRRAFIKALGDRKC